MKEDDTDDEAFIAQLEQDLDDFSDRAPVKKQLPPVQQKRKHEQASVGASSTTESVQKEVKQVNTSKQKSHEDQPSLEKLEEEKTTLLQSQADLTKKLKNLKQVVINLRTENETLKVNRDLPNNSGTEQVHFLEGRINELATEKERLVGVLHGLRGSVDQTAIVLERSHSRFTRLHDQLSATKNSLNNALLSGSFGVSEWGDQDSQGNAMTVNELFHENEELRNTITTIRSHLDTAYPRGSSRSPSPTRSSSPSRLVFSTSFSSSRVQNEVDKYAAENREIKEKLRQAERKLRSAHTVRRRYEQALERANAIIDQQSTNKPTTSFAASQRIDALERETVELRQEYSKLSEREHMALEECERVHELCNELQNLLNTSTAAYAEKTEECERYANRIAELEAHLDGSLRDRANLETQLNILRASPGIPLMSPPSQGSRSDTSFLESEVQRYTEFARKLEGQFKGSQQQSEATLYEKQKIEGQLRAVQAECAELRNTLSRYEATNRDLRSQLSDKEGRIQALESAKGLLSNAMFKTDQENKQLAWQLRSLQGADERITKLMDQSFIQAQELKRYQEIAQSKPQLEAALKETKAERDRLEGELREARRAMNLFAEERALVFAELSRMGGTCEELLYLVK